MSSRAAGQRSVTFVVEPRDGMAAGVIHDDPAIAHLYGIWVAPEGRGRGAARTLLDAVVAWAGERGARHLVTSVTEGNDVALLLYQRTGFADTGAREPLGHSGATIVVLERPLP